MPFFQTPGPFTPTIDHFKCYKVRGRFHAAGIEVEDQFGTLRLDIKKPRRLCAPADKNGGGIRDEQMHLMCYKVRPSPGTPQFRGPGARESNGSGPEFRERYATTARHRVRRRPY